jgi:hypothetical protein
MKSHFILVLRAVITANNVSYYSVLTLALDAPGESTPRTHWIGGWVGLRGGLNQCLVENPLHLTFP